MWTDIIAPVPLKPVLCVHFVTPAARLRVSATPRAFGVTSFLMWESHVFIHLEDGCACSYTHTPSQVHRHEAVTSKNGAQHIADLGGEHHEP